jgi:transcription elongation factor Elf1
LAVHPQFAHFHTGGALSFFSVSCPHCEQANEDPFEVMARDDIDWMNCGACKRNFFFLLASCERCEGESVFAWCQAPTPPEIRQLRCQTCGHGLDQRNEALAEDHPRF